MRYSRLLIQTLKESPKDAEVLSHQIMTRASMIRRIASGIYAYTPLGLKIIRKFEAIVREEMNRIGAQELLLPSMIPSALWQQTGRWDKYGKELLRITDRHDNEFCYGPTHEEVVSEVVKTYVKSYKQLPMHVYQIQTKFRDEIRPRFGLMRGREFIMKDAYSFHSTWDDLDRTYEDVRQAYLRIFERCALRAKVVKADSGAIGGDVSAEFMVLANTGEDEIVECPRCAYAANIEVTDSDVCPVCLAAGVSEPLTRIRGIEVGHIFKLGTTYSEKLDVTFLDDKGASLPMIMGCYGIGIGRTVAAAIEQYGTPTGMCWPVALAPYTISLIVTNVGDDLLRITAEAIYAACKDRGIEVLFDDRLESAGVKFKDTELIGIPIMVVVGKQFVNDQKIEIKDRRSGTISLVDEAQVMDALVALLAS